MFRSNCMIRRLTPFVMPLVSGATSAVSRGAHVVPRVDIPIGADPLAVPMHGPNGASTTLQSVVAQLLKASLQNTGGVAAAPSLGVDARLVVIRSGYDSLVLINPVLTDRSTALTHTWDADGELMHRVARSRNVTVKYTTRDGDVEESYSLPEKESVALQRAMDAMDGVSPAELVSPCIAHDPSQYPDAVVRGLVGTVPRSVFAAHEAKLQALC